jgi:hypothetical protein
VGREMVPLTEEKRCTKCGIVKPLSDFYQARDGHHKVCKKCIGEWKRLYREKNKLKISEQQRAWYVANREKYLETLRSKYAAGKEKLLEKQNSMTEATCPKCGTKHMIPKQMVNMRDRKHYIYCNKCNYLRGIYELKEMEVHF